MPKPEEIAFQIVVRSKGGKIFYNKQENLAKAILEIEPSILAFPPKRVCEIVLAVKQSLFPFKNINILPIKSAA